VLSVYRSFFVGARAGRFKFGRGGDLWRLLASIAKHKLLRQLRHATADRRSVDNEVSIEDVEEGRVLDRSTDPTPEEALVLADELEWILAQLDPSERRFLELRLQGAELSEIVQETGRSERTVRRCLTQIRNLIALRRDDSGPLLSHDDFLLERMIGAGRMGKVYQAWQHSACHAVAVKYLRKSLLHDPRLVKRFIGESRIVARLRHPNIVGVNGLGRTPGGSYFIVMDLVQGPNLADHGKRRVITIREAIRWAIELCSALEHAHSKGIIHCDLKPANLLLHEDGSIRVTDFGLARSLSGLTPWAAEIEGTGPFMAPEQVCRDWGNIDVRTDVYGVGAVLYTLLTGRPPWVGTRLPDILAGVASAAPVVAPRQIRAELPESLSEVCRKCLCKAPDDRYQTVKDLCLVLTGLAGIS
jgi:tRNA A-37 threonylcarbamoyl transferase component Bud32/DNA-directed RNA polymerase specialized sigma24 family protein